MTEEKEDEEVKDEAIEARAVVKEIVGLMGIVEMTKVVMVAGIVLVDTN